MMKDLSPMELARQLAEKKADFKNQALLADHFGITATKASRYLALMDLPEETQCLVDSGLLPVESPLKAIKRRSKKGSSQVVDLSAFQNALLDKLCILSYATIEQLSNYLNQSYEKTKTNLRSLRSMNLVHVHDEVRPFAFRISNKAADRLSVTLPKRWMSSNAMHQIVLRNAIELQMLERNSSVKFIGRSQSWKMGLYPSVGEYLLSFHHEGSDRFALVLIDDYLMPAKRTLRALKRSHKPDAKIYSGVSQTWGEIVERVFIYCTDKHHINRHKVFLRKNFAELNCPVIVREIDAIWTVL